jgi:DNA-binding response OmpR family regulator
VPAALQSLTGTKPQRNVLLIEEYDALAVAIGSALKKFAPQHATKRARSLAEAEAIAKTTAPDLFVIDFDPAYPDLTDFLQKMRSAYPDARVLVIAAGITPEIAAERRSFGAVQFIEKPFEVADFGAAVQALLGPWKESASAQSRGTLRSLSVADVILLQCAGGRSALIEVKGNGRKSGEIYVVSGALFHAETGKRSGSDALEEMLSWPQAQMREVENPRPARRTIQKPWAPVFIEAFRQVKVQPVAAPPREPPAPAKPVPKTGKKIVVIDDTEMLLIFVEDALTTADPQLQISTALNGTSGLKEIERIVPDLVLLDYSLPDLNGDEVCRRLLQDERTARIPVLMMSGHVLEMSEAAAVLDNVVGTIAKPFLSEALIGLVQQTLSEGPRPVEKKVPPPAKKVEPPPPPPKPPEKPPRPVPAITQPELLPPPPTTGSPPWTQAAKAKEPPPPLPRLPTEKPTPQTKRDYRESKPSPAPSPPIARVQPERAKEEITPVFSEELNDVVLGLFLEVVSMQLTPELRMGTIRAKPYSLSVSLHVASPARRAALAKTGFELGRVALDENGRISTLRLIPTQQPFKATEIRNALQIGGLSVVPMDSTKRLQLTAVANAPMTVQLLAHMEIGGVELSASFQVAQLVLKNRSNTFRVTLSSQAVGQEQTGTTCETLAVRLDHAAQIAELLLNPIK